MKHTRLRILVLAVLAFAGCANNDTEPPPQDTTNATGPDTVAPITADDLPEGKVGRTAIEVTVPAGKKIDVVTVTVDDAAKFGKRVDLYKNDADLNQPFEYCKSDDKKTGGWKDLKAEAISVTYKFVPHFYQTEVGSATKCDPDKQYRIVGFMVEEVTPDKKVKITYWDEKKEKLTIEMENIGILQTDILLRVQ